MSESTPRFTADTELDAIHDSETGLYAPFPFVLLALLTGDSPSDVAASFNEDPDYAVHTYEWATRADLDAQSAA